jgi:hypothetical protein
MAEWARTYDLTDFFIRNGTRIAFILGPVGITRLTRFQKRNVSMARFRIEKLERRIATAPPMVRIPSTDVNDPAVNGAEHACKGLKNNHNPHPKLGTVQLFRHGCIDAPAPCPCPPPPPPPCPCPPPPKDGPC